MSNSFTAFPTIDMAATGRRLQRLAEQHGCSAAELAALLGYTPQAVYKYYRGQSLPSVDALVILSCLFSVPIDRLLVVNSGSVQSLLCAAGNCGSQAA